MKTVFIRTLEAPDKGAALLSAIREPHGNLGKRRFVVDPATFASVPRSPFAYWVTERLREVFKELERLEGNGRRVCSGPDTGDDFRCIRAWWEVSPHDVGSDGAWMPHAKGGVFSPFYADVYLLLLWGRAGRRLMSLASANIRNPAYFSRPGLTWPLRTKSRLSMRAMPSDCIFGHKGPAVFVANDDVENLLALLGVCASSSFRSLIEIQLAAADAKPGGAAHSFEVGILQSTPVPDFDIASRTAIAALARRAWLHRRSLDTCTEVSHAFTLPAVLQMDGETLAERAAGWVAHVQRIEADLIELVAQIDERCFDLYGIDKIGRRAITDGFVTPSDNQDDSPADDKTEDDDVPEAEESATDPALLAAELVSWAIGVAFGRFDVRLAIGNGEHSAEPQPFDPLPVCPPAMLTGADGLPLRTAPAAYPFGFPENGILVDDPGHARDVTAAVRSVFDVVFGTRADAWWNEVAALLDPRDHDVRAWIRSSFFDHHLTRYSKSRRKAPILWQLATPSRRYGVWLHVHRLTCDSFFQLQNDLIAPKVAHEERKLTELMQGAGGSPSAKERKEIAAQAAFVEELRSMLDEVKRVTPLWNPTLDDGVVLTMAPLWRLVPHHRVWQRELKDKWDELGSAKYDWARLAMHLWPERVAPKCATDRSLAVAHGLEDVFWVEEIAGKWKARSTPTRSVAEIVRERTSAAVKAALKSLLEAPLAATGSGRGRNPRIRSTAAD
jgi:hypothetical protein